jgi:lipoteichoic acid synthase
MRMDCNGGDTKEVKKFISKISIKQSVISLFHIVLFPLLILFYEWIFHGMIYKFFTFKMLFPFIFGIPMGLFLNFVVGFFKQKVYKIMVCTLSILLCLIYMVQYVYYAIFKTFLTFYSVGAMGGDVIQYYPILLSALFKSIIPLLILIAPMIAIFIFFQEKAERNENKKQGYLLFASFISYIVVLILLPIKGKDVYSPYDLYHNTFVMDKGVEEIGLLTSTRKNITGTLFDRNTTDDEIVEIFNPMEEVSKNEYSDITKDSNIDTPSSNDKKTEEIVKVTPTPTPIIIDDSPNILNIDFNELINKESNKQVKTLHEYFAKTTATKKNEYTGMFRGYNYIMITAEGFSPYAVDKEITPTLYKLVNEGFVFNNFYTPLWWASTIDGEYVACTSLIPKQGVISFFESGNNAMPFAFGNQFLKLGYATRAYHNHSYKYYKRHISHPNMGYDYKGVGNGLDVKKTWPESDLEMMELTIPEYIDDKPFHTYYMTVSGHMNYTFNGNSMSTKNKKAVDDLPYSMEAKAYLACNIELDLALEKLLKDLEEKGIADNTVIALSADHYPYGLEKDKIDELAGHVVEENFELYKNNFVLWSGSIKEPIVIDEPCSSLDIAPTISNLFGLSYDSRLYMGTDILSDSSPLVVFSNRSFINDKVNYNSITKEVTKLTDEELPEDYIMNMNLIVKNKFLISESILHEDYYSYIMPYIMGNNKEPR